MENGLEYLLVHKQSLWDEVQRAIEQISPIRAKDESNLDKAKTEEQFKSLLKLKDWHESWSSTLVKDRVAVEVQFGKYAFEAYDLFAKHLAFYVRDEIDVGIEILPMKSLQQDMSSGPGYYEGELYNVIRNGRGVPAVPLVMIGVAP